MNQRQVDWVQIVSIVLAVAVAVAAWCFGAAALVSLVQPLVPDWAPWLGWTVPVLADLGLVVGALNADRYRQYGLSAHLSWAGSATLTAISALAQGIHAGTATRVTDETVALWAAIVLATLPPVVVLWVVHQLIELRRADQARREADRIAREVKAAEKLAQHLPDLSREQRKPTSEARPAKRAAATKRSSSSSTKQPSRSASSPSNGAKRSGPDGREAKKTEALRMIELGGPRNGGPSHSEIGSTLGIPVATISRWAASTKRATGTAGDPAEATA